MLLCIADSYRPLLYLCSSLAYCLLIYCICILMFKQRIYIGPVDKMILFFGKYNLDGLHWFVLVFTFCPCCCQEISQYHRKLRCICANVFPWKDAYLPFYIIYSMVQCSAVLLYGKGHHGVTIIFICFLNFNCCCFYWH